MNVPVRAVLAAALALSAPASCDRAGPTAPAQDDADAPDAPTARRDRRPRGGDATRSDTGPDLDDAVRRTLGEIARLSQSAQAKLARHDGEGCLADLDALERLVPELATSYLVLRAQCLMEAGRCREGKGRVVAWYTGYGGMTEAGARKVADQIAARHCRGGDGTVADRVRTALADLADAAYVDPRGPAHCAERLADLDRLAPRLSDADRDDPTIQGGLAALFHTAAACYARAGDCDAALRTYRDRFPVPDGLPAAQATSVVRDSFHAAIPDCARRP